MLVLVCACPGPIIEEPQRAEARVLVELDGVHVESDTLSFMGAAGARVTKSFILVNVGRIPLIIEGVPSSSGALVQLDATPLADAAFEISSIGGIELQPGEAVEFPVTFRPSVSGTTQTAVIEVAFDLRNGLKERRPLTLVGRW
ncbi:MAG: hypothetical protein Q8L14_34330 [Myxococcales bacterium]|nr:hypothetical protein [Myxococcales bacterium]